MESSRNTVIHSKWCNLPSDILLLIAKKLDEDHVRQLGAVCTGWNSSLALSTTKALSNFPLEIPCPIIPTLANQEYVLSLSERFSFWVVQRRVVLISPFKKGAHTSDVWITTVEEIGLRKWSVFNPINGLRMSPCSCTKHQNSSIPPQYINLLYFKITEITKSYSLLWVDREGSYHTHSCSLDELAGCLGIKKVIPFKESMCADGEGITVVLALFADGKLAGWKSGCQEWIVLNFLDPHKCDFVDVILFDDKFHVVDIRGNLKIIDPLTLETIKSVEGWYGYVFKPIATYLVKCEQLLYLALFGFDDHGKYFLYDFTNLMLRFVLKENGWVNDRDLGEKCVNDYIFFLGADVSFSVSHGFLDWPGPRGIHINPDWAGPSLESFTWRYEKHLFMDMSSNNIGGYNLFREDCCLDAVFYYCNAIVDDFELYCYDSLGTKSFWPPPNWDTSQASLESSDAYDLKCNTDLCMHMRSQFQKYELKGGW